MKQRKIHNCLDGCSVESTLQFISGKWKCVLLYHLIFEGAYRYSELQRFVPGITKRMLSLQLKELEIDGLIQRNVLREKPIAVSYSITDYGQTLAPVIEALYHWGNSFNTQQSKSQVH
ncbi:HxlR family transcriptional regulator [Enterococcus plantarum]|uniref:winged helix-turn-helix transcriptional regulator n=1 Tax=Enterococcus plantarum TaxID=1077675 RepID=UPI00084D96F0|nr:helix-turn-helix domain-containing protein [Enterococcus plantarum]MBO0468190.1 helix-turn-helix transcriptional regulator [Enterococcus plantarum]OEG11117.1 HxlR family transcriptional regulator [Enterococcus plantarum]